VLDYIFSKQKPAGRYPSIIRHIYVGLHLPYSTRAIHLIACALKTAS